MIALRLPHLLAAALVLSMPGCCKPVTVSGSAAPAEASTETAAAAKPDPGAELYDVDRMRPVASYERLDGEGANGVSFSLESNGDIWRLDFDVGGYPNGAATRADCHVRVEGPVSRGNRIEGVIVEGQQSWSGRPIPSGLRQVVELTAGGARILEDNIPEVCEVNARGTYRLTDPSKTRG